ncbi:metallophosphoesterase family protein [Pedobacter nutrimenti]|uniref:metallophosphoesterase family protein n=1 Tax=Pedobacter nutrimenti TaxID=1241337 RepID=UPI0029307CC0|nr:metallophosphoesterase [Pedobacter nutrimenti]
MKRLKKNIYTLLFCFFVQPICAQTTSISDQAKAAGTGIQHIRWGSSKNPLEGLTVTWSSSGAKDLIRWGYTHGYEKGVFSAVSRKGYSDDFFNYAFPRLKPDATLYYQILDSHTGAWTREKTYRTAPPVNTKKFSFLAIGDSRTGLNIWNQVASLADTKAPDFTIFSGDIVNSGKSTADWDNWFNNGKTFIENNLIFHSMGNHDAASVPTYQNVFELPKSVPETGTNLYYAFTYGDAVFISLNSEDAASTEQYNWLLNTLKTNATKKWKIIFFHKPFYTVGGHAGEMDPYFSTWWKAFDDYGVDLIVNGHDHMYERTKPLNRNVSLTEPVAEYGSQPGQGRCEIVCGGAGAPLYSGTASWFIEAVESKYNLCKFDVTENSICNTTFDHKGNIIDSFCLTKNTPGKSSKLTLKKAIPVKP